jgi:hypothetical protein
MTVSKEIKMQDDGRLKALQEEIASKGTEMDRLKLELKAKEKYSADQAVLHAQVCLA